MKSFPLILLMAFVPALATKAQPVASKVYHWSELKPEKEASRERRQILEGSGAVLSNLEIHTTTLEPGKTPHAPHKHADAEEMIIVKEGQLTVTINGNSQTLGPGSLALALPGDEHGFENTGTEKATYYVIKYRSKDSANATRGRLAGGSFMINRDKVALTTHSKGGVRNYFDRPTAMLKRFEIHATTLYEGLKSHNPHRHDAEEIILMVEGEVDMQIGDSIHKAYAGDLVYLESQILHAAENSGKGPCSYFAIQWR